MRAYRIDLTNQRFGRLVAIRPLTPEDNHYKRGLRKWLCQCDCGNTTFATTSDLRNGHSTSCGRYRYERASECLTRLKQENQNYGLTKTKAYRSWISMMSRCYNQKMIYYKHYGGRGIKVCQRWHEYKHFLEDMGQPANNMTLDRIDNNGDYTPDNCRWATRKEQGNNRRTNLYVSYQGQKLSAMQFSEKFNLKYSHVVYLIHKQLSGEEIIKIAKKL